MTSTSATVRELATAFATKSRPAFRGTIEETKGPQLLVINDIKIPCTPGEFGDNTQVHANYGILEVESTGFTKVPLTCGADNKWKTDSDAKPLAQRSAADPCNVECFPWEIEPSPMNKGPRVEDDEHNAKFEIRPGMTIRHTIFRDPPTFSKGSRDQVRLCQTF